MLDEATFEEIKDLMDALDEKREQIIKESRDVLRLSKRAIYSLHRGDNDAAQKHLALARQRKRALERVINNNAALRAGSFSAACEEFVEAAAFQAYISEQRIPTRKELGVTAEEYLLGLADLTGELARRAVLAATQNDSWEVTRIHDLLQALYGKFVEFDFRNGELRRKYDSIKYNLQKVEEVRYELSLRERGGTNGEA